MLCDRIQIPVVRLQSGLVLPRCLESFFHDVFVTSVPQLDFTRQLLTICLDLDGDLPCVLQMQCHVQCSDRDSVPLHIGLFTRANARCATRRRPTDRCPRRSLSSRSPHDVCTVAYPKAQASGPRPRLQVPERKRPATSPSNDWSPNFHTMKKITR